MRCIKNLWLNAHSVETASKAEALKRLPKHLFSAAQLFMVLIFPFLLRANDKKAPGSINPESAGQIFRRNRSVISEVLSQTWRNLHLYCI